jgi:hypothetical protein
VSAAVAPNARHMPVDELHSIENKADEVGHLCLTLIRGGVKSHSFFDNSDVFPVGAESGAQAVVTAQQSTLDESREADGTAGDEFATVNLNILPLWIADGRSSGSRKKRFARSKPRAQARRPLRKQAEYWRVFKPCGHHKALAVPHLATARVGRAAEAQTVSARQRKPVTAGGARDIAI